MTLTDHIFIQMITLTDPTFSDHQFFQQQIRDQFCRRHCIQQVRLGPRLALIRDVGQFPRCLSVGLRRLVTVHGVGTKSGLLFPYLGSGDREIPEVYSPRRYFTPSKCTVGKKAGYRLYPWNQYRLFASRNLLFNIWGEFGFVVVITWSFNSPN